MSAKAIQAASDAGHYPHSGGGPDFAVTCFSDGQSWPCQTLVDAGHAPDDVIAPETVSGADVGTPGAVYGADAVPAPDPNV